MYCPRVGLAYCMLLHSSSWVVVCGRSVWVAWLMPVGIGERKRCENSLGDDSGVLDICVNCYGRIM
jgi:hypothetical protein